MKSRHYHRLSETELLNKPLRFSSFMSRGNKTIGGLLKNPRHQPMMSLIATGDFKFPLIVNLSLSEGLSMTEGSSEILDAIINKIQTGLHLEKTGSKLAICGIELKSNNSWKANQFFEPSSFADLIYAVLSCDPLFHEKSATNLIRCISLGLQSTVETEIAARFPEVTRSCLEVMKMK